MLFLNRSFVARALRAGLPVMAFWLAGQVHAQFGVSPSQSSSFFEDFRSRSKQMQQSGSGYKSGDVVYDYDSGTYMGMEEDQMRPDDLLRQAREVSQPAVRSGSAAVAARYVGDYTNYAGQYTSPTGYFAPTYVSDPFLTGKRNFALGPVNVGLGFYGGLEYNSNVNRSQNNPVSDMIGTFMLNISANYRVTQNNVLSITSAVGLDHYFSHPELAPYGDGNYLLNILPGSTLAFDVKAGPLYFTFYDRISVRPATSNSFALNAQSIFGVFQNDAGVAMNWAINSKWTLSLNYNNSISKALQTNFEQFNRQLDTFQGTLTYSPHGTWSAGYEGSISILSYEQPMLNDGILINSGAFIRAPIGSSSFIRVAGGLQKFNFEKPTVFAPLGPGDDTDLSDYYFNLSINNQINNRVSHVLSFGHESALNLSSNFITANYVNYGVSVITSKGGRLSVTGYYERAKPSSFNAAFPQAQASLTQYGFDTYYNHQITSRISMGAGYHFGRTDSEAFNGDFDQHAFNLNFGMALTQKSMLNVGYRYFTTKTDGGNLDFNQHRIILGLSYNF
jgi:hypothetical protein